MDGARTRGHHGALEAIDSMRRGGFPHALLISGPAGVGKTTLALDVAASLLCVAPDVARRPCRACRGCRLVDVGHPDLHRLSPVGSGEQIVIGDPSEPSKPRGVRDLLGELSLLPVEGGAAVAIIESAHRMNDDAQAALLKSLEEPPSGATFILCADEERRLAPTIRSRCARIRLGTVGPRDVEAVLADQGFDEPGLAGRLARRFGGRPGIALLYARSPDALRIRGELARVLLDLTGAGPADRLAAMRSAMPAALRMVADLTSATPTPDPPGPAPVSESVAPGLASDGEAEPGEDDAEMEFDSTAKGPPAAVRRKAAEAIVLVWIDVARDLALVAAEGQAQVRDPDLLEELERIATELEPGAAGTALGDLERAATLLAANVSPGLVLDATALAWPRRRRAA